MHAIERCLDSEFSSDPSCRAENETVIEQYRDLLRTGSPETIEQTHTAAFEQLSLEQRGILFYQLTKNATRPSEVPPDAHADTLARTAARCERTRPGTLLQALGGGRSTVVFAAVERPLLGAVACHVVRSLSAR
jgi:hypothetical protein